jgi:predicted DNA-binding transcriptional regulator AlpA
VSDMTLLRLDQVRAKTGLCRSAVYALEGFPKPIKLGGRRAVAWVSSEIDEWIRKTIAASRHGGDEQAA